VKRAHRTHDAQGLTGETLRGIQAGDLSAPVGDATVGDTLAAMLRNNLNGTHYADTGHEWLPDLSLLPLQRFLTERGFTGEREPTRGDVGGVGEMIAGGGNFLPPDLRLPEFRGVATDSGLDFSGDPGLREGSRGASVGWDRLLRGIARVSPDTPAPFESSTGYGPLELSGNRLQAVGAAPTPWEWERFGDLSDTQRAELQPEADAQNTAAAYMSGLQSLLPETYDRVWAAKQRKDADADVRQWVAGGGGTG
jgi:hypothetical protein